MAFAAGKAGTVATFLIACGGSGRGCCGCCEGCSTEAPDLEPTVVETPVRAEFAIRRQWRSRGGGRGVPILVYDAEGIVTVHTPVEVEHRADCFAPELHLLVAPDAERVAYRCAADQPWRIVFVGTEGRSFRQCGGTEHREPALDWTAIPDLQTAFVTLHSCNERSALNNEAKKRSEGWVLGGLERSQAIPVPSAPSPKTRDAWLDVFETLNADKRREAAQRLEGTLDRDDAKAAEVWRSVAVAGEAERTAPATLARVYARLVHEEKDFDVYTAWAGGSLLRALQQRDAPKAASLACTTLTKTASASWPSRTLATHALMVLAVDPSPCPGVGALVDSLCDATLDCGTKDDRHLCAKDELRAELAKELHRPPVEAAVDYFLHQKHARTAYAAALATDSIPKATRVRNERRHYQLEPTRPWCTDVKTSGQPCACFSSQSALAKFVCALDASARQATQGPCALTIDDASKRIQSRRHP